MKKAVYGLTGHFIFKAALDFLRKKKPLPEEEYKAIAAASRAKAFTVSGYTSAEVLQVFLDELAEACEQGKTKKEFMDTMNDFLERNGYQGINPFHADVIFRTNMQTAYNAGHYKSMSQPETKRLRPYWQYITAGDGHVRESHAQMDGRVYAADDPVWDVWFPPNGFRCRCTVVSLTRGQVERMGLTVSDKPPYEVDYGTGEIQYLFPDKGFSSNPAKDVWKPDMEKLNPVLKDILKQKGQGAKRQP